MECNSNNEQMALLQQYTTATTATNTWTLNYQITLQLLLTKYDLFIVYRL